MAIEAQPTTDTPPSSHARTSSSCIHPKTLACVPVVLSCAVRSVIIIYVYIFLCSFHLLYSASIRAINLAAGNSSGLTQWESLLRSVTKICYTTLATGLSCLCIGAYITQNSYESAPATWGLVLMIAGVDALLNMLAILACISATVAPPQAANLDERSVRRVARIFAVPVSSLIWSIIFGIIAVVAYCEQSQSPQLDLTAYLMACKMSDGHGDQDRNQTAIPLPIVSHTLPSWMSAGIGLMTNIFIPHLAVSTELQGIVVSDATSAADSPLTPVPVLQDRS